MELVQIFNRMKRADFDAFEHQKFVKAIKLFIQTTIRQIKVDHILSKKPENATKKDRIKVSCTDQYFGEGSHVKYQILEYEDLTEDQIIDIIDIYQLTLDILDLDINKVTKLLTKIQGTE